MVSRRWALFGIWAAALVSAVALVPRPLAADRPAPPIHRIVAVGDLHGDFAAWRAIATAAGLVDRQGRWAGGDTVLVQTGDVVDRGPDSLKIVQDLMRLQSEAPRAHGRVVALVGNHEAMNITDDLRYVSAGDFAAFANAGSETLRDQVYAANRDAIEAAYHRRDPAMTGEAIRLAWLKATPLGLIEHQKAWCPPGFIGRWVVRNPAVVMLDGTLFVHGGISPAYANLPIAEINRRVAEALAARATADDAIINDPAGPLWYRGLAARDEPAPTGPAAPAEPASAPAAAPPPPPVEAQLDQLLAAYGAKRIVIGHTPILSGIAVEYGGRLVRIDTGISAVFGGKLTYLEIIDGRLVPHQVERPAAGQGGGG